MRSTCFALLVVLLGACVVIECGLTRDFRPPAVPIITHDPQFSVWAPSVNLTEAWPIQWTGVIKAFAGIIRVDGQAFRFIGPSTQSGGDMPPAIQQINLQVFPTRTIYDFGNDKIRLQVIFSSPLLTDDYELLSRPITYITFKVQPLGSARHVQIYLDNTAEIAVNKVNEQVDWKKMTLHDGDVSMNIMQIGTTEQKIMGLKGDNVGINWGYFYVGVPSSNIVSQAIGTSFSTRHGFAISGSLPREDIKGPRRADDEWPVLATCWNLGNIQSSEEVYAIVAYDDIYSIDFFGQKLKAFWTRKFSAIQPLLAQSVRDYNSISSKLVSFDNNLVADLTRVGGDKYATIASLSYRQVLAGMKLVWNDKESMPWYFLKEISSDGDVSTVDVIFPASPILLYLKPELLYLQMLPIMAYANNETWSKYKFQFSPHHLGIYPVCDIQSGEQENMPIEETANMLSMWASVAQRDPKAQLIQQMTKRYWGLFAMWAQYLHDNLPDPGEQLCTDDFEGPSPHNANLAAKGIVGLGAYAYLASYMQKHAEADKYSSIAIDFARQWRQLALDSDRLHTKLEYDKNNTFSLKYNIYYQHVLNFSLFDAQPDITWYLKNKLNTYGVPLDNRAAFTKLDWLYWVAAMGTDDQFAQFNDRGYRMAMDTTRGVPLTDWYETDTGAVRGFRARPVVGGIYARMVLKMQ